MNVLGCTFRAFSRLHFDMKVTISSQGLTQQLDLLVALNATTLGIGTTLSVPIILVETDHLFDTRLVLLLHAQFKLELGYHELDLGAKIGGIIFNQI